MDEKIARWILDFLLRNPIDEKIINGVLSCLPLPNNDSRLKKTILLRKIESETINGVVSEKILELLEIIEELDHRMGKLASDLMKEAYCAVAVDCTVRFLEENVEENGKYFEAVERVWRNRVCRMEGLISEESKRWLGDIEAAVWDSGVCEKIWKRNTRNEALKAVKGYVKEAWKCIGPTYLELVANLVRDEGEELRRGSSDAGGETVGSDNPCRELVASQGTQRSLTTLRRKHVAVKPRRLRGAKISDADEEDDISNQKLDKAQEPFQLNSMELDAGVSETHPDASRAAQNLSFTKARDSTSDANAVENHTGPEIHAVPEVSRVQEAPHSSNMEPHAVSDPLLETLSTKATDTTSNVKAVGNQTGPGMHGTPEVSRVQEAPHSSNMEPHAVSDPLLETLSTKATDTTSNVKAVGNQTGPGTHGTPEVIRVQEALNSSFRELRAAVTDPLPKALQIATLASRGVTVNKGTGKENQAGADTRAIPEAGNSSHDVFAAFEYVSSKMVTRNKRNDTLLDNQKQPGICAPRESADNKSKNVEKKDDCTRDVLGNETHDPPEQNKRKRSLMEPNGTSHTLEWDESADNLNQVLDVGPRLRKVSPLKQYEEKKFPWRRERKKWTPEQEDALRNGVQKFGKRWKLILDTYSSLFKDRTDVDLKDKWRNMMRYHS